MKARILIAVLLLAILGGSLFYAEQLREEYNLARQNSDALSRELAGLQSQAASLMEELEVLNGGVNQNLVEEAEDLRQQARDLADQTQQLLAQIEDMEIRVQENRDALSQASEELTYLEGVCDALEQGIKEVQNYLDGN